MSDKLTEIAEDSARGGFFLFTGNALSLIILAVGSIIIARLLGPENYGVYSLSLVVPSILAGLIDFGISSALIRFSDWCLLGLSTLETLGLTPNTVTGKVEKTGAFII